MASILELPYDEVPFVDPNRNSVVGFVEKWREFLRLHQYDLIFMDEKSRRESFHYIPRCYSIGIGQAANGEDHAVVCLDGQIVHDPYLGGEPLKEIHTFIYFVAMNPGVKP